MVTEGGETMDLTNDERAALAVLNDMTLTAREAYDAAAASYERASMAAALVMVRRALAAEAEVERLRAENATLRASTDAAVDGVRAMLPEALKVAREEGAAAMRAHAAEACAAFAEDSQRELEEHGDGDYGTAQWIQGRESGASACIDLIRALPLDAPAEVKP